MKGRISINKKVTLRKVEDKDIDKLYEWWTNGDIMSAAGYPNGLTISKKEVYQSIQTYQKAEQSAFMMVLDEFGKEIGEFAYSMISKGIYTFDIKIGELAYQGKGYGKKALVEGIKLIKDQGNVKKIEIGVAPENSKALHLYKSVGFVTTKVIKNNWKDQLGQKRSTEILELIIQTKK